VVFAMFAGFYFWWPKFTGRMLDERLGKIHFWLLFVGFHTTFLVQHWLGVEGMPRRYADYLPSDGFTVLNQVSSVGAILLGASMLPFIYNVWKSRNNPKVTTDDPWGWGRSLEWATSCPPPRHNFASLPRIRSESPAFDLHHPEVALAEYPANGADAGDFSGADAPEDAGRVEELQARMAGESDDVIGQSTDQTKGEGRK
jgi:cytochrome c oxidase subunit 1